VLVGVLASGNLEILLEPAALEGAMTVRIITVAKGFGSVWQAVINDFAQRHPLRDVRISINDAGATPAVVSLRLDQAVETLRAGDPR
ncbi:malonate decarboxylase acyl carrier protein, partial [Actinospica durhamensis]|nr:malonate decarboxylase acyl carrier protein [Actinospica durhamensis]